VENFVIRLPAGLRDQIRKLSEPHRCSMNSEIIMVLENHIRRELQEQLAAANPDSNFQPGVRRTEDELNRMLESMPAEKKRRCWNCWVTAEPGDCHAISLPL
jgi:hypothetical protein